MLMLSIFNVTVYRQGEVGSSWYAVLGGSLEARLAHTTQTTSTSTDKVSWFPGTIYEYNTTRHCADVKCGKCPRKMKAR